MTAHPLPDKLPRTWVWFILLAGLAVSCLLGLASRQSITPIRQLDNLFLDTLSIYSASGKAARHAVVIDIDEASLSAVGQWPWPRYRLAALVESVAAGKPAAIGLDIIFPETDRTSLDNIRQDFQQDFGLNLTFSGVPAELTDNDGYLGQVLGQSGVIGAKFFYFDQTNRTAIIIRPSFQITANAPSLELNDASGVLDNTYKIAAQLEFSGFLNSQPDSDGMLRRLPLLIRHAGNIYPHLSLAAFMRAAGIHSATVEEDRHGLLIRAGAHAIPIDRHGYALLRFSGKPHLYPAISALDILRGTFSPDALRGKIVFLGSTAAGLHDLHSTIFDAQFPGLKSLAVMAENMASNDFLRKPAWADDAILAASLAVGLITALLFIFVRQPLYLFLGTAFLGGGVFFAGLLLFRQTGMIVSPAAPVAASIVLFALFTSTRFAVEKRKAYIWLRELANAHQLTIESMAAVAETRDPETGAHIKRVQHYAKAIAERLRQTGQYPDILTREYIDLLFVSAPLHDLGKVGVPDHILLKPGKHTEEEMAQMRNHAQLGRDIICSTAKKIEGENFLSIAGEIAATHHEKWDGSGYPLGLAGQKIPLSGRITAVADVYDALISRRCYKLPFPHEQAMQNMREEREKAFDPVVLDAFFSIEDEIRKIAARHQDEKEMVLGDR